MTGRTNGYLPIGSYAAIGDCHTAALVGIDGSIDWFCPERFDAPAAFCRLLDAQRGGYLSLSPTEPYSATRRYRGDTNILETTFEISGGKGRVRLVDFMPLAERERSEQGQDVDTSGQILRLVEGLEGEVELELCFKPTFDFARAEAHVQVVAGGALAEWDGPPAHYLALGCTGLDLQPAGAGDAFVGRLRMQAGERRWIALSFLDEKQAIGLAAFRLDTAECEGRLAATERYWQDWAGRCTYQGDYRPLVVRSALALKLLTYEPTGAIVAAPTTSLPEAIGGIRNWDYRYTWLRDASLLLYALMSLGYQEEASDFFAWLHRTQEQDPSARPQIMYRIDEGRDLPERKIENLSGYRDSRPVRVGNAASEQLQLDIYGEVLTSAYLHFRNHDRGNGGGSTQSALGRTVAGIWHALEGDAGGPEAQTWQVLAALVEQAAEHWQEPDKGIWEVRGGPQRFLYSQVMCWAALDRGIRLAREYHLPAPADRWQKTREAIRHAILTQGYNEKERAFTQAYGSDNLDASALVIPRVGLLPPTDPRVRSTIDRIYADLTEHGPREGLVHRYRAPDGLPGSEGLFLPCSFWLVEALALSGRRDQARGLFEQIVGRANDVGLLSEEISAGGSELLGNFPQGFSHAALINAAVNIAKAEVHGAEERPETEAERSHHARHAAKQGR